MRPKPPKSVVDWANLMKTPMPKCCHTCDNYTSAGVCKVFRLEPPEKFTQEVDACEQWEEMIPF